MSDRIVHSVVIHAPPERVWRAVSDIELRAKYGPVDEVSDIEKNPDGTPKRYRWKVRAGFATFNGRSEVLAFDPPHSFVEHSEGAGLMGTLQATLELIESGTKLTFDVTLEPELAGMARAFYPMLRGQIDRRTADDLRRLKGFIEGQDADTATDEGPE